MAGSSLDGSDGYKLLAQSPGVRSGSPQARDTVVGPSLRGQNWVGMTLRRAKGGNSVVKVLLILLCLVLPFVAVLIKKGPCIQVLWAFLLQLLGHIPGVIYGIYQIVKD
jgi:uncharacterized membrane protein YqaE (UPF0057 family)